MIMGTASQEQHPASAIKKPTDFSIDAIMRKDDAADSRQNIVFGECIFFFFVTAYFTQTSSVARHTSKDLVLCARNDREKSNRFEITVCRK